MDSGITVAFTRYGESDEEVRRTLQNLDALEGTDVHILFLDQKGSAAMEKECSRLKHETTYRKIPALSLSRAKNTALQLSQTRYVAFTEPDVLVAGDWAAKLRDALIDGESDGVALVGSRVVLELPDRAPWWVRNSSLARSTLAEFDPPGVTERTDVKKVLSIHALNKALTGELQYPENLGRRPGRHLGGEETALAARIRQKGLKVVYEPTAVAIHLPDERKATWRHVIRSFFSDGYSRALNPGKATPFPARRRAADGALVPIYVLAYSLGYVRGRWFQ